MKPFLAFERTFKPERRPVAAVVALFSGAAWGWRRYRGDDLRIMHALEAAFYAAGCKSGARSSDRMEWLYTVSLRFARWRNALAAKRMAARSEKRRAEAQEAYRAYQAKWGVA